MLNLSSDHYPCLAPRLPRQVSHNLTKPSRVFVESISAAEGNLGYIDDKVLHFNTLNDGEHAVTLSDGWGPLIIFNHFLISFPDKIIISLLNGDTWNLEKKFSRSIVAFNDEVIHDNISYSSIIIGRGEAEGFRIGDSVLIYGCAETRNNKWAVIEEIDFAMGILFFAVNTFVDAAEDTNIIHIERRVPDMDYICVHDNRVWGCKGNDIYASKLGDPYNWYYFQGLSTDSYAGEVSTGSHFLGCSECGSHIAFFKENYIHKIIGTKPTNYQQITINAMGMGLQYMCNESIVSVNESLIYKAPLGVVLYSGGTPTLISSEFGLKKYGYASAGTDGKKYYISMKRHSENVWDLFVYDLYKNIWVKEDSARVTNFTMLYGFIYYIDYDTNQIIRMGANGPEVVPWSATLGEISEYVDNKKIYSKLHLRVDMETNSTLKVEVSYDGGEFVTVHSSVAVAKKTISVPLVPRRCDRFQIRLSGTGPCKIHSISRSFQYASDRG